MKKERGREMWGEGKALFRSKLISLVADCDP